MIRWVRCPNVHLVRKTSFFITFTATFKLQSIEAHTYRCHHSLERLQDSSRDIIHKLCGRQLEARISNCGLCHQITPDIARLRSYLVRDSCLLDSTSIQLDVINRLEHHSVVQEANIGPPRGGRMGHDTVPFNLRPLYNTKHQES